MWDSTSTQCHVTFFFCALCAPTRPQPSRCRGTRTDTKFGKVSGACNARMKPMFPKLFSAASSQKTTHKGLMAMPYLFLAISMVFQSTWKLKATNLQTKIASKNHIIKSESAQITGARSLSKSHPSRGFSGHGGIFIEETGMVLVTQSKRVRNDASGGDWAPDGHLKVISPRRTNPHCDKCFAQGFAWPNCWSNSRKLTGYKVVPSSTGWGPIVSVQLVYNYNNHSVWYLQHLTTIFGWGYKPTNITGGPHPVYCNS